jgi:serine O-acetyltransferase
MKQFVEFLTQKVYIKPDELYFNSEILDISINLTIKDVRYHFPGLNEEDIINRIKSNQNELAIFLYRFGNTIYSRNIKSKSLDVLHWLMKEMCSCEIYYSNIIGEGFYVVHGVGTIIGSRNIIGEGFRIYQNCTIGHRNVSGKGNKIGNNVTLYAGSKIIGETVIGDNCIIGANTIVTKSIAPNMVVYGNPLTLNCINPDTNKL